MFRLRRGRRCASGWSGSRANSRIDPDLGIRPGAQWPGHNGRGYRKRVRENFQFTSWPDPASLALRCYRQARPSRSDGPVVGRSYGGTLPVPATLVDREIRELLDYWAFALRTHMLALVVWFGLRRHCSAVQTCLITALGRHARSRLLDVTPMFGSPCSAAVDLSDCCRRLALDWVGWALGAVCPA